MQSHSGCRDDYAHSLLCMSIAYVLFVSREVVLLCVVCSFAENGQTLSA